MGLRKFLSLSRIPDRKHEFLDLGTKEGGSLEYCQTRFNVRKGLGVDLRPRMVKKAIENGHDVIEADALEYKPKHKFRFVSMLDFLEHLPDKESSFRILENCKSWATDFIFIRHPSFEDKEYLAELGFKLTWHDWNDHTNMLRLSEYTEMFRELGLNQYSVNFRKPITRSSDKFVVPLDAPQNTLKYSSKLGRKKGLKFPKPLYGQMDIFVALKSFSSKEWNKIVVEPTI